MISKIITATLLIIFCLGISAEKKAVLKEVNKPSMIDIYGDYIFLMDMEKVKVYSLKDFSHINSFGKKGSGPEEYNVTRQMPLRVLAHKDHLIVEAINKLLFFSHNGIYKKEIKKLPLINIVQPAGNNFVGRRIIQTNDVSKSTSSVRIYDQKMQEVKELFSQDFIQQGGFPNLSLNMGRDFLLFKVYDDMIFVDESARGPFIGVFNPQGERLYEIKVPYQELPIKSKDKEKIQEDLSKDPHILWQLSQNRISWENFSQFFKYVWPKYYPAIQTMDISNNKLYIRTFKVKNDKNEYIVMDLKGKVLKTLYLKPTVKKWIMSTMMGINLEIIHNDKIYYVKENDNEEWELHIQDIK